MGSILRICLNMFSGVIQFTTAQVLYKTATIIYDWDLICQFTRGSFQVLARWQLFETSYDKSSIPHGVFGGQLFGLVVQHPVLSILPVFWSQNIRSRFRERKQQKGNHNHDNVNSSLPCWTFWFKHYEWSSVLLTLCRLRSPNGLSDQWATPPRLPGGGVHP